MPESTSIPNHLAIIMDGNGRWAAARGLPRTAGHRAGVTAVRRAIRGSIEHGIHILTLYAFSSDNWKRPDDEIGQLMQLFAMYLRKEMDSCRREGIRLSVIGRRDRLPRFLPPLIAEAEETTRGGDRLHLRLAVDYSSREQIARAKASTPEDLSATLGPDVDLLVRTAGEQRLSDFLLWEAAYAELVFLPECWPDFTVGSLKRALSQYRSRERRFGGLPQTVQPVHVARGR